MQKNTIRTQEDLNKILDSSPITVITTYRGDWCPFCRMYLKDFNDNFNTLQNTGVGIFAVSIDDIEANNKLKAKLSLNFEIYTDEERIFHSNYGVYVSNSHGKDRHLQPAVFIFKGTEILFKWIQTPKLLNLGGAISRIPMVDVFNKLKQFQLS